MKTGVAYSLNRSVARHRPKILLGIILISAFVRAGYYNDLRTSPLIEQHLWSATDMNYFDRWAHAIAAGDWLSRNVDPPLHNWQAILADEYFAKHPEERTPALPGESEAVAAQRRALALWKTWSGERRFYQEPLYPYLLAVTYRWIGDDVRVVFVWQMLLGIGLNVLIYLVARRAFGDFTGLLAASIAVFYSPLLLFELILLRDSTIAFASMLLTWLAMRAIRRPRVGSWAILGLYCGVSMLLRAPFLAAVIAIGALLVWRHIGHWQVMLRSGIAFGGCALIGLLPLVIRNVIVGVSPFALAGNGAMSFIITNGSDAGGAVWDTRHIVDIESRTKGAFFPTVVETLKTHGSAANYLRLFCSKVDATWRWYEYPGNENFYYYRLHSNTLNDLPFTYFVVGPCGLVGLFLALRRLSRQPAVYLPIAINLPVLLLFFVQARYRIPLAAGLIPFVAYTAASVVFAFRQRLWLRTTAIVGLAAVIMLWTGRPLPVGTDPINPADFSAPYFYFYGAKIQAFMQQGDARQALKLFDDAISFQPDSIRNFQTGQIARSSDEAAMMSTFAQIYFQYAVVAHAAGDQTKASEAAALSDALSRAAQASK